MKMKRSWGVFAVLACSVAIPARASEPLSRAEPEAMGVSSAAVLDFVRAADGVDSFHSVILVRHGRVVAEGWWAPYDAETRHALYSLSKSFTSTAVGLAAAEGKLSVDDPVLRFFPGATARRGPSTGGRRRGLNVVGFRSRRSVR